MWAVRSFLSRQQPLLSCLRPVRRPASQPSAVLGNGGNNLIGSRGYASSSSGDSDAKVIKREDEAAAAAAAKRHLYLVLDDHRDGYGIHKLDIEKDDADLNGDVRRLPEAPVLRVGFPAVDRVAQFAAVGSSIVAIYNSVSLTERYMSGGILLYDTKTGAQSLSPRIPEGLANQHGVYEAAMAVGNRLYILESSDANWNSRWDRDDGIFPGGLHCLSSADNPAGDDHDGDTVWCWKPLSHSWQWQWKPVWPSSPWRWGESRHFGALPLWANDGRITAHAVHATTPWHHDIYVSSKHPAGQGVTFSVSPATGKWTRRGDWQMPVIGCAHYDGELDTWVGLHAVGEDSRRLTDGYLCTGHVASVPKEWKVGREKLFRLEEDIAAAGWRHVDAKLVPMSSCEEGRSNYCLMERLRHVGDDANKDCLDDDGNKCLLRLTRFLVERGKDGEPVVSDRRLASSYKVSRHNTRFDPQVFWM